MRIGLVSDSHGRTQRLARALELLVTGGAEVVVHCGDVGSVACVELLGGCGRPVWMVAGNVDSISDLRDAAARVAVTFSPLTVELEVAPGRWLVATHGHRRDLLEGLAYGGQFAFVCHGHTHAPRDERMGTVLVVNPGALHEPRDGSVESVALLDTETGRVRSLPVPG